MAPTGENGSHRSKNDFVSDAIVVLVFRGGSGNGQEPLKLRFSSIVSEHAFIVSNTFALGGMCRRGTMPKEAGTVSKASPPRRKIGA